jgi:hypothetical protein
MKHLLFAIGMCDLMCAAAFAGTAEDDARVKQQVAGTWQAPEVVANGLRIHGQTMFHADGGFDGDAFFVGAQTTVTVKVSGTWTVRRGFLVEQVKQCSNTNAVPVGHVTKDEIISIDSTQLTYLAESGKILTRRR